MDQQVLSQDILHGITIHMVLLVIIMEIKYKGVEINTYGQSFTDSYNDTYINEYTTTGFRIERRC